jgi:signal transduction histidine kinase
MVGWGEVNTARLGRILTLPSSALVGKAERRQAQMLSAFLIGVLPLGALSSLIRVQLDPGYATAFRFQVLIYGLSFAVYALSRSRHLTASSLGALVLAEVMAFGLIIERPDDLLLLVTPLVPILLASILLSWRATAVFSLCNIGLMGSIAWFVPDAPATHIWTTTSFVGVCAAIVVLAARYQVLMERDRQQELQVAERMAALGTLAAGVAHEINNPLTYVRGNLELLQEQLRPESENASHRSRIQVALQGLSRVEGIVGDLRTFSRQDAEVLSPVHIEAAVCSAMDMLGAEALGGVPLHQHYQPDLPPALANEDRLIQVVVNLLNNALQSMGSSTVGPRLTVSASQCADGRLQLEVSDTGAGISEDHLSQIFRPFFTTKSDTGGMGLGLSMCRSMMVRMGGEISATSRVGKGSCFVLKLPAAQRRPESAQPADTALAAREDSARVLVIDDEASILSIIGEVLSEHTVTLAQSGQRGLEHLIKEDYDLVLCDLMMPGISGVQVFERSVREKPELADRFIFMTGGTISPTVRDFIEQRQSEWLSKPFRPRELRELVGSQLGS